MIAGALAGSATVLITNPIWVVNTRMTARAGNADQLPEAETSGEKRRAPTTLGTLRALLREEGPRALFAGVLPALVLVINPILQYTIFEQLRNAVEARRRVGPRDAFYLGAIGKLLATTITYPYITVKSRAHVAQRGGQPNESMLQSVRRVVREEGWAGLYGGQFGQVLRRRHSTADLLLRNWAQGYAECAHRSVSLRIQRRALRAQRQGAAEGARQSEIMIPTYDDPELNKASFGLSSETLSYVLYVLILQSSKLP